MATTLSRSGSYPQAELRVPMARSDGVTDAPVPMPGPIRGGTDVAAIHEGGNAGYLRRLLGSMRNFLAGLPDTIRSFLAGLPHTIRSFLADFRDLSNYNYCAASCFYYFFCHAIVTLILHICCLSCIKCLSDKLGPGEVKPKNGVQKFFTFIVEQLSNLWATALIVFAVSTLLFRPSDVKPHLGASTVHEFELQSPANITMAPGSQSQSHAAAPHLRFNLTTYLLFKNKHNYFTIGYERFAVAVFYADEKLGPVDDELPSFKQKRQRSTMMRQVFVGRLRNASSTVAETFARERVQGRFDIVLRIRVLLTYKFWPFKAEYFNVYDCPLSSPAPQIGEPALQSASAWCKTVKI